MNLLHNLKLKIFFLFIFFVFFIKTFVEISLFKIPFSHDTLAAFELFSFNYKYFQIFSKFPMWLDHIDFGVPALLNNNFFFPSFFKIFILSFSYLNLNPLTVFNLSISFLNLLFFYGIYLNFKNYNYKVYITSLLLFIFIFIVDFSFIIHSYTFWFLIFPYCFFYIKEFFEKKKISKLLNLIIIFLLYFFLYNTYYHIASFYLLVIFFLFFLIVELKKKKRNFFSIKFENQDIFRIILIISLLVLIFFYYDYIFKNYFFSNQSGRNISGVSFNDLITYANIPISYKIKKFLEYGLIQNEYGFQLPIVFFVLSFFYIINQKNVFKNNEITYILIICLLFLISNAISFSLGKNILYLFYNYLPYFDQFRHSGYLYNLSIPFFLILTGLYINFFLKNIEVLKIKLFIFSIIILIFFGTLLLYVFYNFSNYILFFIFQLISVLLILFAIIFYNFKKFKFKKILFLLFLVLSLVPNYLYSLKNAFVDEKQVLINKISNNQPIYSLNCTNRDEIYKEYEGFQYPGIVSSFYFLHSNNKPCYPFFKSSIYGSLKKHTSYLNTKARAEIYFTMYDDLIELYLEIKKIENSNLKNDEIISILKEKLNLEPNTIFFYIIEIGKVLNFKKINSLSWPNNFTHSLKEIQNYRDNNNLNHEIKVNFKPKFDLNSNKLLYVKNNIQVKKINNEKILFFNHYKLNDIQTNISYSNKWYLTDGQSIFTNKNVKNIDGFLKLENTKNLENFYIEYIDEESKIYLLLSIFISASIFLMFLIRIYKL